VVKVIVSKV